MTKRGGGYHNIWIIDGSASRSQYESKNLIISIGCAVNTVILLHHLFHFLLHLDFNNKWSNAGQKISVVLFYLEEGVCINNFSRLGGHCGHKLNAKYLVCCRLSAQ